MPWQSARICIAGRSHIARGEACDDAVKVRAESGRLVLVLSDGAGSAAHGGEAARLVVDSLSARLLAILLEGASISTDAAQIAVEARAAIGRLRQDLIALSTGFAERAETHPESVAVAPPAAPAAEEIASAGRPVMLWRHLLARGGERLRRRPMPAGEAAMAREPPPPPFPEPQPAAAEPDAPGTHPFACTLVAVIADSTGTMTLHLGDGHVELLGLGTDPVDPFADAPVLGRSLPENGQYSNETFFLVDEDWERHLRISDPVADVAIIVAMTDGSAPFALAPGQKSLHAPLFRPLARWLVTFGPGDASDRLAAVLTDEKVRQVSDDDATLVWACRFSDEERDLPP